MNLCLRPATDADRDFARGIYLATTKPYVDHLPGWTDEYILARFERRFIVAATRMVERDGVTVGWYRLTEKPDETVLEQLYVDPACHRQGIGAAVLARLLQQARKPFALRTLRRNPARRLYERFGFRVVDESEPNSYGMRFVPSAQA